MASLLKDRNGVAKVDGHHIGFAAVPNAPTPLSTVLAVDPVTTELYQQSAAAGSAYGSFGKVVGAPQVVVGNSGTNALQLPSTLILPVGMVGVAPFPGSNLIEVTNAGIYRISLGVTFNNPIGPINYLAQTSLTINGVPTGDHGQCGASSATPNYSTTYHLFTEWFVPLSAGATVGANFGVTGVGNYNVERTILNIQQIG